MRDKRFVTWALLSAIVVLLILRFEADVTGGPQIGTPPKAVGITAIQQGNANYSVLFRVFEDGTVEMNTGNNQGFNNWGGWEVVPEE